MSEILPPLAIPYGAAAALRERITAAYRRAEPDAVTALVGEARLTADQLATAQRLATTLADGVRAARTKAGGVDALMLEFSLESREGIALMCLAEALLRIPDTATRDRLIRDKIAQGDWHSHIGRSPSLFVNAAAWGLLVTGKLVDTRSDSAMEQAVASLLRKGGEPLIRKGVDLAMRLLGKQFVTGRTIDEALVNAREREARGYRYSFDMLGEAALTMDDAAGYCSAYETAIHAIGKASARRRRVCGSGYFDQAVGAASTLFARAAGARAGRTGAGGSALGATCARLRHRPQHRRRGSRPPRPVARHLRSARRRPGAGRLEWPRFCRAGLPEACPRGYRLAGRPGREATSAA